MCNHPNCPEEYCKVQFYHDEHDKMNNILNLTNSEYKCWGSTCYMPEKTKLQFCGVMLTLYPNGTYNLSDTSG